MAQELKKIEERKFLKSKVREEKKETVHKKKLISFKFQVLILSSRVAILATFL